MSNKTITLTASKRDILGKQVRGLRNDGQTPAVVHDHGKDSIHIAIEERELKKAYHAAGKHHMVTLNIDGKAYTTLIKDVTYRPATSQLYHTVFQSVKADETVKAEIPIHLTGEIPAERASFLVLQSLNSVEVEALPKDLVDALDVDATVLEKPGDTITVADLKVPTGVEIKSDPELTIATVEMPRDQIAEADAAQAELAADAGVDETAEGEDADAEAEAGTDTDTDETKAEESTDKKDS
ncbi:MAG: 50S ribosomal protein L25 [Candidatus Saccharimonadales bacterium]